MEPPFGDPPGSDEETLKSVEKARRSAEYFYQWYAYVAETIWICVNIYDPQCSCSSQDKRQDAILRGLLTRVVHTMRGVLHLTQEGQMAEVAAQLDRSITETCVLVMWLIKSDLPDRFDRFVASSLRRDFELEEFVKSNIAAKKTTLPIEQRILSSISHYRSESGLTEEQIRATKKLPDLRTMVELCLPAEWYSMVQTSPSKVTHPSWYDLRRHYLEPDSTGDLRPKWCDRPLHAGNFFGPCAIALIAVRTHTDHYHADEESRSFLLARFDQNIDDLMRANRVLS